MRNIVRCTVAFLLIFSCSQSDTHVIENERAIHLPILTTATISEITQTTATSGGKITDDGGAEITSKGVCWSKTANPTISDLKTSDGSGDGEFDSAIVSLEAGEEYFVRSYATNSQGTSYGNELIFKTLNPEVDAKVFEGDVVLTSQKEVDEFGAENYTKIIGSLGIRDSNSPTTIQDLSPLNSIKEITLNFHIVNNDALVNIVQFSEMTSVLGDFLILDNINLKSISGFDNIREVGKSFRILGNYNVETLENHLNIEAFKKLQSISGEFTLSRILNTGTFFELETVESKILIEYIQNIVDLSFIPKINSFNWHFHLWQNENLENMSGLSAEIKSVRGELSIGGNPKLMNLSGLENIGFIETLHISDNAELNSLNGFNTSGFTVNNIEIFRNASLVSLNGLQFITAISDELRISSNDNLEDISALENIAEIGGEQSQGGVNISSNNKLIELKGLENIHTIKGELFIYGNSGLKNLNSLSELRSVSGEILISENEKLDDFCGLQLLLNSDLNNSFDISENAYNPSAQDIRDGNCKP
ncbi:hypothetical protein [Pseudozobellia sp. WGM2]|uniref:hypothetical protein n=1 Tax=Pseudozobellia sp. WGM2 TaxID=2787625 RepID=UPI001ADFD6AA|nr:hypothetical protein [Pseudozobellia sp. WGM2]